eukprot:551858_1
MAHSLLTLQEISVICSQLYTEFYMPKTKMGQLKFSSSVNEVNESKNVDNNIEHQSQQYNLHTTKHHLLNIISGYLDVTAIYPYAHEKRYKLLLCKTFRIFEVEPGVYFTTKNSSMENIIKQEVLRFIPEYRYDVTENKTKHMFFKCYTFRKYKTITKGQFGVKKWQKGVDMSLFELLCLRLFMDHTILQQKCKQLCHFSHKILAVVSKFGTNTNNMPLYFSGDSKLIVNPGNTSFALPLSLTASYEMACRLAQQKTVLTLRPTLANSPICRALNVSRISDDPDEEEYIIGFMYSSIFNIKTWIHKNVLGCGQKIYD